MHAKRGDRANYRPVRSTLCDSAEPLVVISALLELHPFETLYIADLNAIQRSGHHGELLKVVRASFPRLNIWVDAGLTSSRQVEEWDDQALGIPIVGAESIADEQEITRIASRTNARPWILSMDFRGDTFLGPASLLDQPSEWPRHVLAMNLARVGGGDGPDVGLIRQLASLAPKCSVYAAGGIGSVKDFDLASRAGAQGALVATALHDGRITSRDLLRNG